MRHVPSARAWRHGWASCAVTSNGTPHARNTPTIFNVGLSSSFNWDGVADTLEAHAEIVLRNPSLMDITWPAILARLGADDRYVSGFRAAYRDGLTRPNVLDALTSFERSLETPDSRFDRYLQGEHDALTDSERRGFEALQGVRMCDVPSGHQYRRQHVPEVRRLSGP